MQYCPKESGRGYLFVVKYKREKVNNIKGTGKVSVFVCFFYHIPPLPQCDKFNWVGTTRDSHLQDGDITRQDLLKMRLWCKLTMRLWYVTQHYVTSASSVLCF